MMAALILGISTLTLLQFFVAYCHSLVTVSRDYTLSQETLELTSVPEETSPRARMRRLLQLVALCPEQGNDRLQIHAVSAYFGLLSALRQVCTWLLPTAGSWVDSERRGCACVIEVTLDRRIAANRFLMAQQSNRGF
jgi:hypothetical protein